MADLASFLTINRRKFVPVVPFDKSVDTVAILDFTASGTSFTPAMFADGNSFATAVNRLIRQAGARYGYGGYGEHRTIYNNVSHFQSADGSEPRRLHLGTDIWGEAGTPVMAPFGGLVHSMAYNGALGDYGATVILSHQLEDRIFYTLYGHLSLKDIDKLRQGIYIVAGETFAHFGTAQSVSSR